MVCPPVATDRSPAADFLFLEEARGAVAALETARTLGLFERLDERPAPADALAAGCGTDPRATARLLVALTELGVVQRSDDGAYELRRPVAGLVREATPWDGLAETVRTGTPAVTLDQPAEAEVAYADCLAHTGDLLYDAAEEVADLLRLPPGARLLDLAAGSAPWAIALAQRDPTCRVTALDLPKVLQRAEEAVAAAGCAGQFELRAGDVFSAPLGEGRYDLVIVANVCHLFPPARNRRLLARAGSALRPGGRLAVVDSLGGGSGTRARWITLYSLGLLQRTSNGGAHPLARYRQWLEGAGLRGVERTDLSGVPMSLVVASRPA